ncbi:MAG TPA: hypothetical protein VFR31_13260, partial [Thermoanaerobaculia bacterium]|nr:hypothetical protein [Thermoanaerobaculia bacterium]
MERSDVERGGHQEARESRLRWLRLAALLSLAVVVWEYLLNAVLNPADWNLAGVGAHMVLDLAMVLPILALAMAMGLRLARRFRMGTTEWAGVLGIAGLVSLLFLVAMTPVVATRDYAHEWMGNTYGLSLAEVQLAQAQTNLTVQQPKQLCSFASVRNPGLFGDPDAPGLPLLYRIESTASALLLQLAALLPLLLLGLLARWRAALPKADLRRPLAVLRWWSRPVRFASLAGLAALVLLLGNGITDSYAQDSHVAGNTGTPYNACTSGGPVKEYRVHAINVIHTVNRYFDYVPGFMYALEANIPAIRAFEQDMINGRAMVRAANNVNLDAPGLKRVTPGLRKDPIQPLVIRANLGDCVRIHFTNDLA